MTIAIPSLRAITCTPQWVRNDLWRRARAVPSLDLQFADRKSLVDAISGQNLVTFTRASSGTYVDSAGVLQTAGANEPRFDHNPTTGESLGLLVEEQRSNEVRNSNDMSAVVTGSPGTLPTGWIAQDNTNGWTREVVGSGSLGALNYVDIRFYGTPSASLFQVRFQGQGVVAASNGQAWAASVYHQLVGGSLGNVIGYPAANLWDSSVAFIGSLSTPGTIVPTASLRRYTGSSSISLASAAFVSWGIAFTCTVGNTYDFTLRFAAPQLEQGSFATSVIPTTGTAATRNADVASITGTNFSSWYRQDEGTFYGEAINAAAPIAGAARRLVEVNNNSEAERIFVGVNANTTLQYLVQDDSAIQANLFATIGAPVSNFKTGLAFKANDFAISGNGGAVSTDNAGSLPTPTMTTIGYSTSGGNSTFNGHIRRLTYFSARLPNATLQAITQ